MMETDSTLKDLTIAPGLLELTQIPAGGSVLAIASNRLSQLLRGQLNDLLLEQGNTDWFAWRIYTGLARLENATQKQLVAHTRIEQSRISRVLASLEEKGVLVSSRCETDKRARRFRFTPKGEARYQCLLPVVQAFHNAIDQALTDDETEQYLRLTERLAQAAKLSTYNHNMKSSNVD